ncbi:MAG: NUDIX domain-containing protein [Ignavibacteriales bacterium]|nr:NUDIX domain-containing protein [Ignavibacteriales bacterium]
MQIVANMIEAHVFAPSDAGVETLLLKRAPDRAYPNVWQMVTGHVEEGETAWRTALREIEEETGLTPREFFVAPTTNAFYDPKRDALSIIPVFLAVVDRDSTPRLSDEHSEMRWFTPERAAPLLAWKGQRDALAVCAEYLTNERSFLEFVGLPTTA